MQTKQMQIHSRNTILSLQLLWQFSERHVNSQLVVRWPKIK